MSLPRAQFRHNPLSDFPESSVESYEFILGAQQVEAQDAAGTGGLSPGAIQESGITSDLLKKVPFPAPSVPSGSMRAVLIMPSGRMHHMDR